MKNIQLLLNIYKSSYYNKFCLLVRPLENMGLDVFCYTSMSTEGEFFQISNQPECAEHYYLNQLYKDNPYIRHPDNFFDGQIIIPKLSGNSKFNQIIEQIGKRSGFSDNLVFIFKKRLNNVFWFAFSSSKQAVNPVILYLNYPELINRYILFFHDAWNAYQTKMEQYVFNAHELVGQSYLSVKKQEKHSLDTLEKEKFLKTLGFLPEIDFSVCNFTKRERECIDSLLRGNTASMIAKNLEISNRTVEHHLEHIKDKLGCETKAELLNRLSEMQKMSLF